MHPVRAAFVTFTLLFFSGCAGPAWQTPVSSETHQDVKSFVDYHISTINQIERRLESADTKDEYIATLEFAGNGLASLSSRRKLLVARYPALNSRNTPPSPLKEEFERLFKHMREKVYVIQSLQAGAVRYGSHPSVMKAIQNFVATVSQGAD